METKTTNANLMAALTYLFGFITGIIFLLIEKKDQFIRFHAMQSVIASGGLFIFGMAVNFIPGFYFIWTILGPVELILWIFLMYKAYTGEKYKLPYIGEIAEQQLAKIK